MDTATGFRLEILNIDPRKESFSTELINTLQHFTFQHYSHNSPESFSNLLNYKDSGDLAKIYDYSNKLIRFIKLTIQHLRVQGRDFTVFLGETYQDPRYTLTSTVAKFGLVQAMKYKLAHPEKELVVFSKVNTPEKYQFLANMSEVFFPRPDIHIPEKVVKLVQQLKKYNHWTSASGHPMLIDNQFAALNSSTTLSDSWNKYGQYYLSINPQYQSGTSLLVYLPLNLATIGHGMKQVVTQVTPLY